jgi:glycosyltransferase involved in cell wall biosynthesis
VRRAATWYVRGRTARWPERSRLFTVGDRGGWSVDEDARHIAEAAQRTGVVVGPTRWTPFAGGQCVFVTSHFEALQPRWTATSHALATAYLHGRPDTPGYPEFDDAFAALSAQPQRLSRIQVTHAEMHELVLSAGVAPEAVHRIPIGVDIEHFSVATAESRARVRLELGLPPDAFVVGSFQKDGVGWGEGLEPKLVKGPDVLVDVVDRLRADIPELVVLLTGPARGYVTGELARRGISYRHHVASSRAELARVYHALDVYVVTSRQEGGPKALLEAMASGVALVSTRVGQAGDVVEDGVNGLLAGVEDVEGIAAAVRRVRADGDLCRALVTHGRETAERYANEQLDPLWAALFDGFVGIKP